MIVKNEERNLPACLESVADLVDQIVIADTGSTDRTKEVAARFGAKLVDFPWVDSFAAARNASLAQATGEWVLWLDADDRLDAENRQKLRRLLVALPAVDVSPTRERGAATPSLARRANDTPVGFVMKCLCLPDPETKMATAVHHLRLFRNHPGLRWRYRVHEQILPALRATGGTVQWTDIVINHTGYQDATVRVKKRERDLRLLHMEQKEQPDDPFTLFNLGSVYQEMGRLEEAVPLFRRSLERSQPADSIVRKLYTLIAQCQNHMGKPGEALASCAEGRRHFPDDAEILFQEATAKKHLGDVAGAIGLWEQVLLVPEGAHFASVNTGLRGFLTRHNLATAYMEQGQFDKAEDHWRAALAEKPDYPPLWIGLAELAAKRQRWEELEKVIEHLRTHPEAAVDAGVFQARLHLGRREFTASREILASTISSHPQALWPRVILSHVLLQEGRDWSAAEQALRDILALDPNHREAQKNLQVLLQQQGRIARVA